MRILKKTKAAHLNDYCAMYVGFFLRFIDLLL